MILTRYSSHSDEDGFLGERSGSIFDHVKSHDKAVYAIYARIDCMGVKVVSTNRKARFNYHLFDTYEAGLVLRGSEIKSIRAGQISLAEAYIRVENDEAWLINAHIAHYDPASRLNHDPLRRRKLLLRKKEIMSLWNGVRKKGMTIIPLSVYLKDGIAKVEIALAKGKKQYDKRAAIAKRDVERDVQRQLRDR